MSSVYNYQALSQSQKISIGIVVDSADPQPANVPASVQKEASNAQRSTTKHHVHRGVKAAVSVKHTDPFGKPTSSSATVSSLRGVQPTHSVQTAHNEDLSEHGVSRKRLADKTSLKDCNISGTDRRSDHLSLVRNQPCMPLVQEARSKETLRMNLRQILGTNAFSSDKVADANTLDLSTQGTMYDQNAKGDHCSKPKQNSDPIETDSENVSITTKRPVTRSLARNKAQAKGRTVDLKLKSLLCDKEAKQGNIISSRTKKSVPSRARAINHGNLMTEPTDGGKKSYGIKPGDLLSPITDLKNTHLAMTGGEKSTPVKEIPLPSVTRPSSPHSCLNENIEATMQDVNLNYSPVIAEKCQLLDSETPVPQEKSEHHKFYGIQTPAPQDDGSDWPLFKMRKNALNSPMGLLPVYNDKKQQLNGSPREAGQTIREDKRSSMSSSATDNDSDYPVGTATPDDRHANAPDLSIEDKDADHGIFTSVIGESDSTEEVSSMKRDYTEEPRTSSETSLVEKPFLFLNKRRRSQDVNFNDFTPAFTIPTADDKMDDVFVEASEENADDGLARVISVLGRALEKVKSKIALAINRRCLDILVSSAEELHSQLQDAESQIQANIGKLTRLNISKRKNLETRLQEQQAHLKIIHEKFKEEILKYLQECRGAVERLETQHKELKGAIETQEALHRKLVLQAEAAVENHIVVTQRKITAVHKMGKKKMQQLKVAIGECLKDVI